MRRPLRARALVGLAALSAGGVLVGAPNVAVGADLPHGPVAVRGAWTDTDPLTVVSAEPVGANLLLTATGSSSWSGSLTGTTTFVLRALVDPAGRAVGTIQETFVGTVAGVGSGSLHFTEAATQDAGGALRITAIATTGTGDLSGVAGALRFVGTTDPAGVGDGQYVGTLDP